MPNWCDNEIIVKSNASPEKAKQEIAEFLKAVESEEQVLDFEKIVPLPDELKDSSKMFSDKKSKEQKKLEKALVDKYGASNWYDFCCTQWGTKWNACDPSLAGQDSWVSFGFQTAWSPPEPIVAALAEKFHYLDFSLRYIEMGCCFAGEVRFENGVLVYEDGSQDISDPLFQELAEQFGYSEWLEEMEEEEEDDEPSEVQKHIDHINAKDVKEVKEVKEEKKLEDPTNSIKPTKESLEIYRNQYM